MSARLSQAVDLLLASSMVRTSPLASIRRFSLGSAGGGTPPALTTAVPASPIVFVPSHHTPCLTRTAAHSAAKSVTKSVLRSRLLATFDADDGDGDHCSICLNPVDLQVIEGGKRVAVTACGHCYHIECWKSWAERDNRTCPNCRCQLVIDELIGISPVLLTPPPSASPASASNCTAPSRRPSLAAEVLELVHSATDGDILVFDDGEDDDDDENIAVKDLAKPDAAEGTQAPGLATAASGVEPAEREPPASTAMSTVSPTPRADEIENTSPANSSATRGLLELSYRELQAKAKQAGVRANGRREDLMQRLELWARSFRL